MAEAYKETEKTRKGTATAIIDEIQTYEKDYQRWERRGDNIVKRFRDERNEATNARIVSRKFNILWSNTETLKPTLYARAPNVQAERRFKDADPTGRVASEIAERTGNYLVDTSPFDEVMKAVTQDYLLPGRGIAWINYQADFANPEGPMESGNESPEEEAEETSLEKIREMVSPIYVLYKDFGHSPVRRWQEVTKVWRICHMKRPQLIERFGDKLGNKIPLDNKKESKDTELGTLADTATIYEVWCKRTRKVKWVHKSHPDLLEEIDPPVELQDFFPCPRPIFATLTNDSLIPVPLFALYQDQAAELDKLTNRIGRLTDALKIAGVYDSSIPELQRILAPNGSRENVLIAVSNYAGLKEKGGVGAAIDLVPLNDIAQTLISLYEARDQVLQVIYQVTGLADIIRGASNPNETATAQSIKGQFASLRIKDAQQEVARFARDLVRIMVEMAVEMYEPETLYEMVQADSFTQPTPQEQQHAQLLAQFGMEPPKPVQQFAEALRLLRDDKMRSFRIDIETDSTIALNDQEEKEAVNEFLTALGSFMSNFGPMIMQMPSMAPVAGEALLFATRRYRAGRQLENVIEQAVAQLTQMAAQPKPDPEQIKAQQEQQMEQMKLNAQTQQKEKDRAADLAEAQAKLAAEGEKHARELAFKSEQAERDRIEEWKQFVAKLEQELKIAEVKEAAGNEREFAKVLASTWDMDRKSQGQDDTKKLIANSNDVMKNAMEGMTQALQALAAPTQVIRDERGKITGTARVQ